MHIKQLKRSIDKFKIVLEISKTTSSAPLIYLKLSPIQYIPKYSLSSHKFLQFHIYFQCITQLQCIQNVHLKHFLYVFFNVSTSHSLASIVSLLFFDKIHREIQNKKGAWIKKTLETVSCKGCSTVTTIPCPLNMSKRVQ